MPLRPHSKPPEISPVYCPIMKGTAAEFINQYIGFYVYAWTKRGYGFWLYPTSINRGVLRGYIWKKSRLQSIRINVSKLDCLY